MKPWGVKAAAVAAVLVLGLGGIHIRNAFSASVSEPALALVTKRGLGANLSMLGFATAQRTVTYRVISNKLGDTGAQSAIKAELQAVAPKYQDRWNRNLAESYAEHFTAEELTSLAVDGKSSKHLGKFHSKQNDVGKSMETRSRDLLIEFVTEAMNNALKRTAAAK